MGCTTSAAEGIEPNTLPGTYRSTPHSMPTDNCIHDFEELASSGLPQHYSRHEKAIRSPVEAKRMVGFKTASREALNRFGRTADFPGCYVFLDADGRYFQSILSGSLVLMYEISPSSLGILETFSAHAIETQQTRCSMPAV